MRRSVKLALALVLAFALFGPSAFAAGVATGVSRPIVGSGITKFTITWTSDGSGNVNANPLDIPPGHQVQLQFVPNGGGTAPTAAYDIVLNDANGMDVLAGQGADLSATVPKGVVMPAPGFFYDGTGPLSLSITNAGASKGGTVILWVGP